MVMRTGLALVVFALALPGCGAIKINGLKGISVGSANGGSSNGNGSNEGASNGNGSNGGGTTEGGGTDGQAATGAASGDGASQASGDGAESGCKGWIDGQRSMLAAWAKEQPSDAAAGLALMEKWEQRDGYPSQHGCTDKDDALVTSFLEATSAAERPVMLNAARAIATEDPKKARNVLFRLFRNDDKKPDEELRKAAQDISKRYDAALSNTFKENGGLGKKDNGEVMCVFSRSPLPAGGSGASGFATHFDGAGPIHVGCRLQSPAAGMRGKVLLNFNADTGAAERKLVEVNLGEGYSLGGTTWVTGKFTPPGGEDFAKTVHYVYDAQVILQNVFDERTVVSEATFTWHK